MIGDQKRTQIKTKAQKRKTKKDLKYHYEPKKNTCIYIYKIGHGLSRSIKTRAKVTFFLPPLLVSTLYRTFDYHTVISKLKLSSHMSETLKVDLYESFVTRAVLKVVVSLV